MEPTTSLLHSMSPSASTFVAPPSAILENSNLQHILSGNDYMLRAVAAGEHAEVKRLLQAGTSVHATPGNVSCLHIAAAKRDPELIELLLEHNAEVDAMSDQGSALHCASQSGCTHCVSHLLRHNASIDMLSPEGLTPIMSAAVAGEGPTVVQLAENGADLSLAFLPGTKRNLLHVCADQDLVLAAAAVLDRPDGPALAYPDSDLKPVYSAALNLGGLGSRQDSIDMINMLLPHSGLDPNTSYDDLVKQADSAQFRQSDDSMFPNSPFSTLPDATAQRPHALRLQVHTPRLPSRNSSFRMCFTPTANLDCTASDCSPLSRFERHGREWSPSNPSLPSPQEVCSVRDQMPSSLIWDSSLLSGRPDLTIRTHATDKAKDLQAKQDSASTSMCMCSTGGSNSSASTNRIVKSLDVPTPSDSLRDRAEEFSLALLFEAKQTRNG